MRRLIRDHIIIVVSLVAVVAGFLGWLAGAWTTCPPDRCDFDVPLFEAWGTWGGGLATALAVLVAAYEVNSARQDQQANLSALAQSCTLRVGPFASSPAGFDKVQIAFTNKTQMAVTDLVVRYEGTVLGEALLVNPRARAWMIHPPLEDFGLGAFTDELSARKAINAQVRRHLEFEFAIGRSRYSRKAGVTRRL